MNIFFLTLCDITFVWSSSRMQSIVNSAGQEKKISASKTVKKGGVEPIFYTTRLKKIMR